MSDPRIVYLERLKLLQQAESTLDGIIKDMKMAAILIHNYERVLLPDEDTVFSPNVPYGDRTYKILGKDWPSFEQFGDALRNWRQCRLDAETAYDNVPDKTGLEGLRYLPALYRRR